MSEEKYLSFYLSSKIDGMIETSELREIVKLEDSSILPLFDLAPAIMGVFNLRGEMVWLVDLPFLLGLQPLSTQTCLPNYSVMIMVQENQAIGLACQKIGKLFSSKEIQTTSLVSSNMFTNFEACVKSKKTTLEGDNFWLLDFQQILNLVNNKK